MSRSKKKALVDEQEDQDAHDSRSQGLLASVDGLLEMVSSRCGWNTWLPPKSFRPGGPYPELIAFSPPSHAARSSTESPPPDLPPQASISGSRETPPQDQADHWQNVRSTVRRRKKALLDSDSDEDASTGNTGHAEPAAKDDLVIADNGVTPRRRIFRVQDSDEEADSSSPHRSNVIVLNDSDEDDVVGRLQNLDLDTRRKTPRRNTTTRKETKRNVVEVSSSDDEQASDGSNKERSSDGDSVDSNGNLAGFIDDDASESVSCCTCVCACACAYENDFLHTNVHTYSR
jgi:hypothetical protein